MTALIFADTNLFIYALDEANPEKQRAARAWRSALWKSRCGRISYQVLQEFYVNVAQKWPQVRDKARAEVRDLLAWKPEPMRAELLEQSWKIQDRYQLSFWDSLIAAAAKSAGCHYLLTEDLQENQNLDGVTVINPFHHEPSTLLLT